MLITIALAASLQGVPPQPRLDVTPPYARACALDALEKARGNGVVYRGPSRTPDHRRLDELPDADIILTVLKRDESGCPIIDIVQRGVGALDEAPIVGVPLRRTPSLLQGGRQRDR